jgi:multiple sugar transport system permease protein
MHKFLDNRNVLGLLFMLPAAALLLMFLTYPLGLGLCSVLPMQGLDGQGIG